MIETREHARTLTAAAASGRKGGRSYASADKALNFRSKATVLLTAGRCWGHVTEMLGATLLCTSIFRTSQLPPHSLAGRA